MRGSGRTGGGEENLECPLCFNDITSADEACRTVCNHVFCTECLLKTLSCQTPVTHGSCPLCRGPVSLYTTVTLSSDEPLRKPDVCTIFGSVYMQGRTVGVASYHFDSETDCYISYTEAPPNWVLDDGSRPPVRKPFTDALTHRSAERVDGRLPWRRAATPSLLRSRAVFGRIRDASHQTWWDASDDA